MKIEGQSLKEIFAKLPWQYKLVVVMALVALAFLIAWIPGSAGRLREAMAPPPLELITVTGLDGKNGGLLDPSIAYNPDEKAPLMAYTQLMPSHRRGEEPFFSIRIAQSRPGKRICRDWNLRKSGVLQGKQDTLFAPDGKTVLRSGQWRYETPALIYDPGDRLQAWKLFAYKYFVPLEEASSTEVVARYGSIVYSATDDPSGGTWSTEKAIFSPAPGYPPAPYAGNVLLHLSRLDPALADVVSFTRPSGLVRKDGLFMSFSAFTQGLVLDRIVMIVSRDHARSWAYVGVPLTRADLAAFTEDTHLVGAALFEQGGEPYLAVTTGRLTFPGQNVSVFAFEDFSRGILARDAKGALLPVARLSPDFPGFVPSGGFSYNDVCGRYLMTSLEAARNNRYRILAAQGEPVNADE